MPDVLLCHCLLDGGAYDGTHGTSGLIRGPESGPLAAREIGAVVERDRPGPWEARGLDSWRAVIEWRGRSSRSHTVALDIDAGRARRNFAGPGDGCFNPADRRHARASTVDRQP